VSDWPELRRFVAFGASLRAAAEAELGLCLGKRASADPAGLLATLQRAGRIAPGIVALYVGMAESWAKRFGLPRAARPKRAPTVDQAAEAIAVTLRTHRTVRWAQWRPLVAVAVASVLLLLSPSPLFELLVIGMFVALWAWQAWARDPADALYLRVVQPTAAIWLWATGASPDELASALGPRLPAKGSWPAFFHPVDPSVYPDLMGNDLTLLAFSVTAPMIPGRRGPERHGVA
jgi:hypothetical protein